MLQRDALPFKFHNASFAKPVGTDLIARTQPFFEWVEARRAQRCWPYSNSLYGPPGPSSTVAAELGVARSGVNFSSQDYLGLAAHPVVREAAARALLDYGPHSAGSPMVQGNSGPTIELEAAIGSLLDTEHVALFPTGWAAGFGAIAGLVRRDDHVVMDRLCHQCLQQGAFAATPNVSKFDHLDAESARAILRTIRAIDAKNGVLVVSEGLFSMDSDTPDFASLQAVCHEYGATLLVDVAHDLGALGPHGAGRIAEQGMLGKIDLVMGSFSKTFASNGGFLASHSPAVRQFVKLYGGTHCFSNALSPVQASTVRAAIQIVQSAEGDALRTRLLDVVHYLRDQLAARKIPYLGVPSAIVPVVIGDDLFARLVAHVMDASGVFLNFAEYPVVAIGSARFRMQAMATHTREHVDFAAQKIREGFDSAAELFREVTGLIPAVPG